MKLIRRFSAFLLTATIVISLCGLTASAKTAPDGQMVGTVLLYVKNSKGENILVSQTDVVDMDADLKVGKINKTVYNYSVLDHFVTVLHQECQGFTVAEYIEYAQARSTVDALKKAKLSFLGNDTIRFWEIDDISGENDVRDTYTWNDLYGVPRYNYPLLYQYWNYNTQDYHDPSGKLTRDEVIDLIFENRETAQFMLSVNAFSQRYMSTDEKYGVGDFNMENYWYSSGKMDSLRSLRMMVGMTEAELRGRVLTAHNTRYWVWNLLLDMETPPNIASLGIVSAPTATVTEDRDNYYVRFDCATPGATIYYNNNYRNISYMPTSEYTEAVMLPKMYFPAGKVTITAHAVKDGYTDVGVVTLTLAATGTETKWNNPYSDVADSAWYYEYVEYVSKNGLFDATGAATFSPDSPMTRAMLATALWRTAGKPKATGITNTPFTDVTPSALYTDAVAWCYETGVVNGTSGTTFTPDGSVTREQITAMFYRYSDKIAKADMGVSDTLSAFSDKGEISSWALENMRWAVGAGLINGTSSTTVSPQGTASRAQVAAMLLRLAKYTV